MTFDNAVEKIQTLLAGADASQAPDSAFQIHFTNKDCEGTMYIAIQDGQVRAEGYDYKDNTAAIDLKVGDLTKILNGTLNPLTAAEKGTIAIYGDAEKTVILNTLIPKEAAKKAPVKRAAAKKTAAKPAEKKTAAKAAAAKTTAAVKKAETVVAKKAATAAKKAATVVKKAETAVASKTAAVKKAAPAKQAVEKKAAEKTK